MLKIFPTSFTIPAASRHICISILTVFALLRGFAEDGAVTFTELADKMNKMERDAIVNGNWITVYGAIKAKNSLLVGILMEDRRVNLQILKYGTKEFTDSWLQLKATWKLPNPLASPGEITLNDFKNISISLCLPPRDEQLELANWLVSRGDLPQGFGAGKVTDTKAYERGYILGVVLLSSHVWDEKLFTNLIINKSGIAPGALESACVGARDAWERRGMSYSKNGPIDRKALFDRSDNKLGGLTVSFGGDKSLRIVKDGAGKTQSIESLNGEGSPCGERIFYGKNGEVSMVCYSINSEMDCGYIAMWAEKGKAGSKSSISINVPGHKDSDIIKMWHENGQLNCYFPLNDLGKEHGTHVIWNKSGKVQMAISYNNGIENGPTFKANDSGEIEMYGWAINAKEKNIHSRFIPAELSRGRLLHCQMGFRRRQARLNTATLPNITTLIKISRHAPMRMNWR